MRLMVTVGFAFVLCTLAPVARADQDPLANEVKEACKAELDTYCKQVTPGDQLRIEVNVIVWRTLAVKMEGTVTVDGKKVCEATVTCQLVNLKKAEAEAAETKAE